MNRDMDQALGTGDTGQGSDAAPERSRRPDWFHRGHPVFFPLAGFYTGMVSVIVVPGLYVGIVQWLAGNDRAETLLPFVLLIFAVPVLLLVPRRTRRFGRYMLLGMVSTLLVVGLVAAAVAYFLYQRDS